MNISWFDTARHGQILSESTQHYLVDVKGLDMAWKKCGINWK